MEFALGGGPEEQEGEAGHTHQTERDLERFGVARIVIGLGGVFGKGLFAFGWFGAFSHWGYLSKILSLGKGRNDWLAPEIDCANWIFFPALPEIGAATQRRPTIVRYN